MIDALETRVSDIEAVARLLADCLLAGGRIFWMGNGGSAAQCQHLAAELVGRFRQDRGPLASVALTTDTSVLTAIANDYGYEQVFARQVEALCAPGDVLVGLSTSGASENLIVAFAAARRCGVLTVGLAGAGGGRMRAVVDHCLAVSAASTACVQEGHQVIGHLVCGWIEAAVMARDDGIRRNVSTPASSHASRDDSRGRS